MDSLVNPLASSRPWYYWKPDGIDDAQTFAAAIAELQQDIAASGLYPLLAQWMGDPQGLSTEQQMIRGLDFLLDGIGRQVHAADPGHQ